MVRKRYLLLLLTAFLGLGLLALDRYTRGPSLLGGDQKVREADYYGINLISHRYAESGLLGETLYATRSDHYPDEKTTYFVQPRLVTHLDSPTTLTADKGHLKDVRGVLFLNGHVRLESESAQGEPLLMVTDSLIYNSKTLRARTDDPVRITGPGTQIEGTGMLYDVKQERLQLSSKVKTRYEPQ